MPRVSPSELKPYQIPGKLKVDPNISFIERCHKRFEPTDTIQVRNITSEMIEWWWLEEKDESYVIEDGSNVKIVSRKDPGLYRLNPGEFDILSGSCAYIMMDALFKQTRALKTGIVLHPLDEGEIRNFALDDPQHQEEFINMVFEGRVTPQMMQRAAIDSLGTDPAPRILENLTPAATEESEYQRRMGLRRQGVSVPASLSVPPTTRQAAAAVATAVAEPPVKTQELPHEELGDLQAEFEQQDPLAKETAIPETEPLFPAADGSDPRPKKEVKPDEAKKDLKKEPKP